jgi:hypothetical protein
MVAALAVVLALASSGSDDSPYSQTIHQTAPLAAHGEMEVDDTFGDVRVSAGAAGTVDITAVKHADAQDRLDAIGVHVDTIDGAVKISTDFPAEWSGLHHHEQHVDYLIKVPTGTKVILRGKYGDGYVSGIGGPVDASSRYGDVEVDGAVGAQTLVSEYGDVTLSVASIQPTDAVTMSTTYGDVTLTLPSGATPAVHAVTRLGDVHDDFDVRSSNGPAVDLRTTFGDVDVRKGES